MITNVMNPLDEEFIMIKSAINEDFYLNRCIKIFISLGALTFKDP